MANVLLYIAGILTASSAEVCKQGKCVLSSTAMIQYHQESSVARLAHGGDHPTNMLLNNTVNLWAYGMHTDVQADLMYDGQGANFSLCEDGSAIAQNLLASNDSKVVALNSECYYKNETFGRFFSVLEQATSSPPPFVLVFAGFDSPLNKTTQDRISKLRGLKACYATNLHDAIDKTLFFPMPIGVMADSSDLSEYEEHIHPIAWEKKAGKLLIPLMTLEPHTPRGQYRSVLSRSEFSDLVDVTPGDKNKNFEQPGDYLQTMAGYKAVLSPVGNGYDCCRHWESLAVGTVPLVMRNDSFDMRLFDQTGIAFIPPPEELTPDILRQLLESLQDPSPFIDVVDVRFWAKKWRSHLS